MALAANKKAIGSLSTQVSNKHHYLPVFYTKRWAGADGRICEFSKPYQNRVKPRRVHPDGTGYVNRLYEIKGLKEELKDQFERLFLKSVDSKAADALAIMEEDDSAHIWNSDERSAWTRFLLSLLMRMPEDIQDLKAYVEVDFSKQDPAAEAQYAANKSDDDPPTFSEWIEKHNPHVIENSSFQIAISLMNHKRIGEDINNFKWSTINTGSAKFELLTSDRPLVMSPNLGSQDAFLMLPIGPRRLFLATRKAEIGNRIKRRKVDVLTVAVNTAVVEAAVRYAYASDDRQLRFVQNRMGLGQMERWLARLRRMRS